jgi:hypothetical protein
MHINWPAGQSKSPIKPIRIFRFSHRRPVANDACAAIVSETLARIGGRQLIFGSGGMAAVQSDEHKSQAVLVLEGGGSLSHEPVEWAMGRLRAGLAGRGITLCDKGAAGSAGQPEIVLHLVADTPAAAARPVPDGSPEAFAVVPLPEKTEGSVALCARDPRGLVHAILEYADLVTYAPGVRGLPVLDAPIAEAPRIPVRSISRCFSSEIEDKGWLHDKDGWRHYLDMLAEARINRFALTLGMHYNYPYGQEFLNDVYLIFAYPFLLKVPGFEVYAEGLSR